MCLGAQLIADLLGSKVYHGEHKEIGWFPIELTAEGRSSRLFNSLPEGFKAFHWHGDTFDLPAGATHLAKSAGCEQQAFLYNDRVLGLQFHVESTVESVQSLVNNCANDITHGTYVQGADHLLTETPKNCAKLHEPLEGVLKELFF